MIEIEGVSKTYRKSKEPAVRNLNLELKDGEIVGFAGLNGAGKTTTIHLISGVLFPDSGTITVDGHNIVSDKIEASKNIGWVPELPNYDLGSTPLNLLKYYSGYFEKNESEIEERRTILMKRFGIWEYRNRKLRNFSQGMKKRFSLVAASQTNPQNYLFDETLNGLDPEGVRDLRTFMLTLKKEGKCLFLSSHILSELELVADRIAIIKGGELISLMDRKELQSLGSSHVKLTVENIDKKGIALLEKYGAVEVNGTSLILKNITGIDDRYFEINRELVLSGYNVSHFEIAGEGLESYFLELVEK